MTCAVPHAVFVRICIAASLVSMALSAQLETDVGGVGEFAQNALRLFLALDFRVECA